MSWRPARGALEVLSALGLPCGAWRDKHVRCMSQLIPVRMRPVPPTSGKPKRQWVCNSAAAPKLNPDRHAVCPLFLSKQEAVPAQPRPGCRALLMVHWRWAERRAAPRPKGCGLVPRPGVACACGAGQPSARAGVESQLVRARDAPPPTGEGPISSRLQPLCTI